MRQPWRKSGQGNDARQGLCCPESRIWIIRCGDKAAPAPANAIHLGGFKGSFAIELCILSRSLTKSGCGLGTGTQIQEHRVSCSFLYAPVTANTRGS